MPHDVIMPVLGMAQDSGLLVRWLKAPGAAVAADDILFEVETDKSTVEVNAGHDGFIAALLAEEGEDVPTGQTIAVISAEKPANPIRQAFHAAAAAETAPPPDPAPATEAPPQPQAIVPPAPAGRILASPKARRLALEQGLDLARLAAAGHSQPYRARDIDRLRALSVTAPQGTAAARRLTADLAHEGFTAFADWAAETAAQSDRDALLAGLAAASLGQGAVTVAVQALDGARRFRTDGDLREVQEVPEGAPDLLVRDLRFARLATLALGAEDQPVLTLTRKDTGLTLTLECAADQLGPHQAVRLLSEFAGRIEQPLRHLL